MDFVWVPNHITDPWVVPFLKPVFVKVFFDENSVTLNSNWRWLIGTEKFATIVTKTKF